MTYQELQQAYQHWQSQYNMACQNPALSHITTQAYNEMARIANMMQQYQQQQVGYGNQYIPPAYNQQQVGFYPARPQQNVGYYPQQPQQNFNFGSTMPNNAVPSMQVPNNVDRHSEGRYQKLVQEKLGIQNRPQVSNVQFPPSINTQVQQAQVVKPTKHMIGHKWSYLCGNDKNCVEEIQGDYLSYKTQNVGGLKDFTIDDMTDGDEQLCPEKAANKYAYITGTQAAFVDLKFSKTYSYYNLKTIFEAVSESGIEKSGEEATKFISDALAKSPKTNASVISILCNIPELYGYIDSRYSGIFNNAGKTIYELGFKANEILTDHKSTLDYIRTNSDERIYASASHLVEYIKDIAENKDKLALTFVEGEKEKDTYLKLKWDYTNKGMYVDYCLFTEIERLIRENTIDKGKSDYYKITSLSYQSLYDILNQSKMETNETLYIFARDENGSIVAYEITKGDIGTFYIHNNKFNL